MNYCNIVGFWTVTKLCAGVKGVSRCQQKFKNISNEYSSSTRNKSYVDANYTSLKLKRGLFSFDSTFAYIVLTTMNMAKVEPWDFLLMRVLAVIGRLVDM